MTGAPVTEPIRALSAALYAALSPVVPLYQGVPACYWLASPEALDVDAALGRGDLSGLIICQLQGNMNTAGWVGEGTAEGAIVLHCIAMSDDAAQTLAAAAIVALGGGVSITGYRLALAYTGETPVPPRGGRYTAAPRYDAEIRRV
jgi:hypothetical protein